MAAGLAGKTPCAIISRATTKRQRTHRTTVLDLHRAPQLAAPTLLVVGEVVSLADPAAMVEGVAAESASRERQAASSDNFPRHSSNGHNACEQIRSR